MVRTTEGVSYRNFKAAYAGIKNSLKQEWHLLQRTTLDVGPEFRIVEESIWE